MNTDDILSMGITLLLRKLEKAGERSKWRRAFLKVFRAIGKAYKGDQEFVTAAGEVK